MSFFSFGIYFGLLSHCIRLHFEAHSEFKWFSWSCEYDESLNGVRIIMELCKTQLFIGIGACVHDTWHFDSSNFFIRQTTADTSDYMEDINAIIEDDI